MYGQEALVGLDVSANHGYHPVCSADCQWAWLLEMYLFNHCSQPTVGWGRLNIVIYQYTGILPDILAFALHGNGDGGPSSSPIGHDS